MSTLQAELVTCIPSPERFAELASAWFTQAREELVPDLDRGLKAGPSLAFDLADLDAPKGPPGGASGMLWVRRKPALAGGSRARYTDRSWQRLLVGLSSVYPFHAELMMEALDGQGMTARPDRGATIGVHRNHRRPEWATFEVSAYVGIAWSVGAETIGFDPGERQWAEFIKQWATRADACYAHVSDDSTVGLGTALEQATARASGQPLAARTPEETVPRCRDVLRGYSWVTVCSPELADRLGGAQELAASGAFDEVTELPGGQLFLRATPAIESYRGDALRRAFEMLAPVLLTGRPDPASWAATHGRLLPDVNATNYQ